MIGNPVATGLSGAVGSSYLQARHQLAFVEFGGRVSTVDLASATYTVAGTGWTQPEDIAVAADGDTAYVTERSGDLVRISLSGGASRAAGTVVAASLSAPHQIALDEAHGVLYVVEFADPGRLLRVDLASHAVSTVAAVHFAIGLLLSADGRYAYVTEQTAAGRGTLSRIDLATATRTLLYSSSTAPLFMMSWSDPGQNAIIVPERDPANTVWSIDLNTTPVQAHPIISGTPARPSSVGVVTPDRVVVCCDTEVVDYPLTGSVYTPGGPLLLGIGFVPRDRVDVNGLADTTGDPSYFFQVKDCPFGGSLPLMVNHPRAVGLGAAYYKILVDGVEARAPFSDYLWDTSADRFVATVVGPDAGGFYRLHQPGEVWYNPFLGAFVDTTGLAEDALHTIAVQLYTAASDSALVSLPAGELASVRPRIVNAGPLAVINGIEHDGTWLNTCAIVLGGSDLFQFSVTAAHPSQFLRSWGLAAYWGDNRGEGVTSAAYPGGAPGGRWNDPNTPVIATSPPTPPPPGSPTVPAAPGWSCTVAGDTTSRNCAHTFELDVYDRVINGWSFIHGSSYRKSITILLDVSVPHLPPIPPHIPIPVPVPHLPGPVTPPGPAPLPNPKATDGP